MYIGHDAEFAVVDGEGKAVSAHSFFPPKDDPIYTGFRHDVTWHRDQIFRDGTSLEVNTPGGLVCCGFMLNSTMKSLRTAQMRLPAKHKLMAVSAYEVKDDLAKAPTDVLNSGCSPVRNAYEGWEEKAIYLPEPESKQRFAGGHIHLCPDYGPEQEIMGEKTRQQFCAFAVPYLDLFLAIPMLYVGVEGKNGAKRREIYGRAGEYRFQTYKAGIKQMHGIEYRVLGPEWLRDVGLAALTVFMARSALYWAILKYRASKTKRPMRGRLLKAAKEAINAGETKEVYESKAYQKVLGEFLKKYNWHVRGAQDKHFRFMRENAERLFGPEKLVSKETLDGHNSWPQCLDFTRWRFQTK